MRYVMAILAAAAGLMIPAAVQAEGALVIVGGGLADDNDDVFAAFLGALPAPDAPIAIIPAASGVPAQSAAAFAANLERRGVAPERIRIIRLAVEDDPDTPDDESLWLANGEDDGEVSRLANIGGIWFTGGDQARIIQALVREDGYDTPMLGIIRARFAAGAVIGGSSAGAAIMSRVMIRQGDPLSLVPGIGDGAEPIRTGPGLGFLRRHLVDQHFGERARLPRLLAALRALDADERAGFGIDEDTALVIAPGQTGAQVVGRGHVTLADARGAVYAAGAGFAVRGAAVALFGDGDQIDLERLIAPLAPEQSPGPCLSAPSAAGLPVTQSRVILRMAGSLEPARQATCLLAAGETGLAMRFYRSDDPADNRLMLDLVPMQVTLDEAAP